MWFYTRLAWLSVPWENRDDANAQGELLIENYIVEAKNVTSGFAKAERILSNGESTDGKTVNDEGGVRSVIKIGVLVLEPILDPLVSGACVYDEEGGTITLEIAKQLVMPEDAREHLAEYEQEQGGFPQLDVYHGDDFDKL